MFPGVQHINPVLSPDQQSYLAVRCIYMPVYRHLGSERVYLPLQKVADTPFHIQGDDADYNYVFMPSVSVVRVVHIQNIILGLFL